MKIRFDGDEAPDEARHRAPVDLLGAEAERAALETVLRRELDLLRRRLRKRGAGLLRPSASAGDLVQEAMTGLLRVRPSRTFDDPAALRAYLWKAAWRLLLRRSKRPLRDLERLPRPGTRELGDTLQEAPVERRELGTGLRLALALLPEEDRQILELVYLRELGIPGAAQALGIRPEAANMRVVRARRRLKSKLQDWADWIG